MTEKTRKTLVFSLLPLALIWAFFNMGGKENDAELPPSPPVITGLDSVVIQLPEQSAINFDELDYLRTAAWGEDPFRLKPTPNAVVVSSKPTSRGLILSGILYSTDNPVAIINGSPIRIGQEINGAKVIEIEKDKVILERQGKKQSLTVSKG